MDLKLQLPENLISGKKHVDRKWIFALGIFGALLIVVALWLRYHDWSETRAEARAVAQGQQAAEILSPPVQSLRRVLNDPQVQELAVRAIENPDKVGDLLAYVNGRISQIEDVRVFPADTSGLDPANLGPSGYAVLDMVLSALSGGQALMQVHNVLDPPRLFDAALVKEGEEVKGVIVVSLPPEYVLNAFTPEFDGLDVVRLVQYNGHRPPTVLKEFGDPSRLGEVPERVLVPGTVFRVEFPNRVHVVVLGPGMLWLVVLIGLACAAAAWILQKSNQKWARASALEKAKQVPKKEPEPPVSESGPVEEHGSIREDTGRDDAAGELKDEPDDDAPLPPPRLLYNLNERRKTRESDHTPVEVLPEIFRAYDIRGVIDKTLDSGVARAVGMAVGTVTLEKNAGPVVVARDGRLSGPYLMKGMIEGILATGCDVLDIGAVPTGVLYFAAHEMAAGSGVMITGSHNPPDYNGFKIMVAGDTLYGDQITALNKRITSRDFRVGEGESTERDVVPDYIERIAKDIQIDRPLKIVVDCGNGIGGVCAADTLRAIGAEVLPLFDEVDGTFPNHHPDPSDPENLQDLIESVRLMDADLGLAFDGDADRLGVVTLAGNIIYPDRIMMLLAMDVLDRVPGATIIYDVKCTSHLPKVIKEAGGKPVMYKTGHSLIKAKMKEIGSPFAGEMSGHFFFGERWYGVDDGIYAAARLLEILGGTETPPEAILNALPASISTPELKVQMEEGQNHAFIEAFKAKARFDGADISTIDGLRADFQDGWGLVRASNTTPILVVRFDAETEEALVRIKASFRSQMLEINPDLELPF
ncbi:MAG: phosphomannomutase/phosphoglucomutase [Lysobacterales bacterium]|jgi:phosphomannomutase/phosphoglucomutase